MKLRGEERRGEERQESSGIVGNAVKGSRGKEKR